MNEDEKKRDEMSRAYYHADLQTFLKSDPYTILGELSAHNEFELTPQQRYAWEEQITILQHELKDFQEGYVIFEYTIPRIGQRVDVVFITSGIVFLLEFKVGETKFKYQDKVQVEDYALNLNNFHEGSHEQPLVPILVSTNAEDEDYVAGEMRENIAEPQLCNAHNLSNRIKETIVSFKKKEVDPVAWMLAEYHPTPTIIEAAQALYSGHTVADITHNEAKAENLRKTADAINALIDEAKENNEKIICFITGVPGAGKTLAGLNIANERHEYASEEHAVFLSGNGSLVEVLQEALTRNEVERGKAQGKRISKENARRKVKSFIQPLHHFRNDCRRTQKAPIEKVAIFDEAQRAWSEAKLSKMSEGAFESSEPEFLIEAMDRHQDWAVIVALVGGGQEIHDGEAGLLEWFRALKTKFPQWKIAVSDKITDREYIGEHDLTEILSGLNCTIIEDLHQSVSARSFRNEKLPYFINALLDGDLKRAQESYKKISEYEIYLTRDLNTGKRWLRHYLRGTERVGLTASSGARRLRAENIWVDMRPDVSAWFLNDTQDIRSSNHLELAAKEFDVQGLELDRTLVGWDADYRYHNGKFEYWRFAGTTWKHIKQPIQQEYLKNKYRVLLTRARQGFIIFVPRGDIEGTGDATRKPEFYDETYEYLKAIGIPEL